MLSAVGGAALSAIMSDSWGKEEGVGGTSAFIGGALMLFGARLASGCTRYVAHYCTYNYNM